MKLLKKKELILKKIVGDEGYTKDSQGRLALTEAGQISQGMKPVGKNLIIEEEGFSLRDVSDLAGIAPESIGAVIGGIIGAPTLVGGALGAGVGAGLGQSAEESIESLLGIQKQSLGEVAKDVATEAALAGTIDLVTMGTYRAGRALIQGAGKGANAAARAMGQAERPAGQEQAEQALRIMDRGGLPSYEASGMGAGISKISQIAEAISGKEKRAVKNVLFALKEKEKILRSAGILDVNGNVIAGATVDDLAKVIADAAPAKATQLENALADAQKKRTCRPLMKLFHC